MAHQAIWYYTELPKEIIDIIEKDLEENYSSSLEVSKIGIGDHGVVNEDKRKSKSTWVPSEHWIGGFVWHYIQKANRDNFLYDLNSIDGETLQYTVYEEGEYYGWHNDANMAVNYKSVSTNNRDNTDAIIGDFLHKSCESVRKLSFTLLLSDPDTYEGGNLQIMDEDGRSYIVPRQRGVIVVFDSRTQHRVHKVTKGVRKSLVGWVVGPRWK